MVNELEEDFVSKTELKKEAEQLQALGKKISEMNATIWTDLPISADLLKALQENHKHTNFKAKRRHLQFIGKLMRGEQIDQIEQALYKFSDDAIQERTKIIEYWRAQLLTFDKSKIDAFFSSTPNDAHQRINNILRSLQKLNATDHHDKMKKLEKELFKILKDIIV